VKRLDCDAYAAEIEKRRAKQGVLFAVAIEARHACKRPPASPAQERDCDTDLPEGRAALRRGAYAEAKAIFEHAVACYSNNEERRFYLVAAACRAKDDGPAKRDLDKQPVFAQIVLERICRENGVTTRR
jgi:hypothetical protein